MPAITNRRMPLSCEPCRERKIRCPRNTNHGRGPCETCVRRGIPPSECVYLRDIHHSREQANTQQVDNNALLVRIKKLEELLQTHVGVGIDVAAQPDTTDASNTRSHLPSPEPSLQRASALTGSFQIGSNSSASIGTPSNASAMIPSGVLVRFETGHERYEPSSSRWSSILGVNPMTSGLKGSIDGEASENPFPFVMQAPSINDLLSLLPPQSPCDQLKNIFFGVYAPVCSSINSRSVAYRTK